MKKEEDQNILGHTTCAKCGKVHWKYANCPSGEPEPAASGQAGIIRVMDKVIKDLRTENEKLTAESNGLKEQLEKLIHPMQVLPAGAEIEVRSISDEEVWLRAWCACSQSDSCKGEKISASWADACLERFKNKFGRATESE